MLYYYLLINILIFVSLKSEFLRGDGDRCNLGQKLQVLQTCFIDVNEIKKKNISATVSLREYLYTLI